MQWYYFHKQTILFHKPSVCDYNLYFTSVIQLLICINDKFSRGGVHFLFGESEK